jgi:hypothetical protein
MPGKPSDIRQFQNRMNRLAAVGALSAIDFPGYFPIEIMDRKINPPDREIRSLEKAAECPVGLFALLCELLNSLDVGFDFHISESGTLALGRALRHRFQDFVSLEYLPNTLHPFYGPAYHRIMETQMVPQFPSMRHCKTGTPFGPPFAPS